MVRLSKPGERAGSRRGPTAPQKGIIDARTCQTGQIERILSHEIGKMPKSEPVATPLAHSHRARFWLRELPYIAVLTLTILGVAYTSASRKPLIGYWEFLAVAIGLVCVTTGWLHIHDPKARFRIVWTQTLHWLAFLVAMNIVLLPSVQRMLNAPATGLALLMLLALGTFVAGVHVSWQIC